MLTPTCTSSFRLAGGEQLSLAGFFAVNRERLKALDGDKLAELARGDALELLYIHLQSMRNFRPMIERVAASRGEAVAPMGDDELVGDSI